MYVDFPEGEASPPPSYTIGTTIQPAEIEDTKVTSIYTGQIIIYTSIDQDMATPFDAGDSLTGRVVVVPNKDTKFDKVAIELHLVETFKCSQSFSSCSYISKSINLSKHHIPSEAYPEDMVLKSGLKYTFTYSLIIPTSLNGAQCENSRFSPHYELPSSLGSICPMFVDSLDVRDKRLTTSYQIRTRIYNDGCYHSPTAQSRRLVPVRTSYPPCLEAYATCEISKRTSKLSNWIASTFRPRRCPQITLSVQDVPALYIQGKSSSVVNVQLTYIGKAQVPNIAKASYTLQGFVTTSKEPLSYYPQLTDSKECSNIDSFPTQVTTFTEPVWKNGLTRIKVPLTLPEDVYRLVPTFFTCNCSRQYVIKLTLSFDNSSSASVTFPVVIANKFL
ncbi:hypothetical protein TRICI_003801 [Trichomonascus ciferrii]|uniref:Bul1 C-terminal domain-containing protein n=1 Tax=Trichomonascus ciferrii TaxID=44093 RepID=A0A642V294_9ASCO|nr:hypothetical protein TRICI_003801 [Trichomonascus ciferrii]